MSKDYSKAAVAICMTGASTFLVYTVANPIFTGVMSAVLALFAVVIYFSDVKDD